MSEERKEPREFWIYTRAGSEHTWVCDFNQRGFIPNEHDLHVIEYQAYLALEKQVEELKFKAKDYDSLYERWKLETKSAIVFCTEKNALKAELEQAKQDRKRVELSNGDYVEEREGKYYFNGTHKISKLQAKDAEIEKLKAENEKLREQVSTLFHRIKELEK